MGSMHWHLLDPAQCTTHAVQVRKIGEGTFGEAFRASGQVLKIVPMEGNLEVGTLPE